MANYWNEFYKQYDNLECSRFCKYVINYTATRGVNKVLDAGCGNGRDSYRLSSLYEVTGVDTSSYVPEQRERCNFLTEDFCVHNKDPYDLIYSRFTFHAITNEQHKVFLKSIKKEGTILCIECRSDKDKYVDKVYGTDHYRNYINKEYLMDILNEHHFVVEYIEEGVGFSPYKTEDPVCIRLIATRINVR